MADYEAGDNRRVATTKAIIKPHQVFAVRYT
jgi:hypothetical protein